ncbi:ARF guanine-nucleotide exchange factor GNOM-like protein [Drosera capensis]
MQTVELQAATSLPQISSPFPRNSNFSIEGAGELSVAYCDCDRFDLGLRFRWNLISVGYGLLAMFKRRVYLQKRSVSCHVAKQTRRPRMVYGARVAMPQPLTADGPTVAMQFGADTLEEHKEWNGHHEGTAILCTINTEIGTLLAAMRRNVRWGGRFVSGDNQLEDPLVYSLKDLHQTSAIITGVVLSSVYKILTLDAFDLDTVNIADTMHMIVDTVASCRFEVTDPVSEEHVLMKILRVLLACMKSKASVVLSNRHICLMVSSCFRVVRRARTKRELLRLMLVTRCMNLSGVYFHVFLRLSVNLEPTDENGLIQPEYGGLGIPLTFMDRVTADNVSSASGSSFPSSLVVGAVDDHSTGAILENDAYSYDLQLMQQPYGLPCMVEVFQFLYSLLDIAEHEGAYPKSNTLAFDEDVPLLALGSINSAIKFGGPSFRKHPRLLSLIQDDLFFNLTQCGSSTSPLILSMVCSIVLNLYYYMRAEIKLQLEAFFPYVILRLAQSRYGASYQQQEIAMEALVDFCREKTFMVEMYANLDSEITSSNVFEDLVNLLSKSAFPVNSPLSALNTVALDGLITVVQAMAERNCCLSS